MITVTWDQDAGQVMLEALPEGPAGGARLSPITGVELIFDCAGGQLSRVFVAAGEAGSPPVTGEPALAMLKRLLGSRVAAAVRQAARRHGDPIPVRGDPAALAAMSRLARLDAARLSSPVAGSPLWLVEAAQLAARAGLTARVTAEARSAAAVLAGTTELPSRLLAVAAEAVADLVAAAEPDLASKLRDALAAAKSRDPAVGYRKHAKPPVLPDINGDGDDSDQLHWSLDSRLIPAGLFEHSLWPDAELTVRVERSRLDVEARLAPGADRWALATCRARLVDPVARRVLGVASFHDLGDSRVRAEIRKRRPSQEAWVEIVDNAGRPVFSSKLHHMRRAMRWADAALAAGRQTSGLADAGWATLAATAWGRSAQEWAAAGDDDRAYLAACHQTAVHPGQGSPAESPSGWAQGTGQPTSAGGGAVPRRENDMTPGRPARAHRPVRRA